MYQPRRHLSQMHTTNYMRVIEGKAIYGKKFWGQNWEGKDKIFPNGKNWAHNDRTWWRSTTSTHCRRGCCRLDNKTKKTKKEEKEERSQPQAMMTGKELFCSAESFGACAALQRCIVTRHIASHWLHGLMICTQLCIILILKPPREHVY